MRREISKRFTGQSVSNIIRVVQTEGTYVSRQVQGEEMHKAGFDAYYIDSVEDKHTCDTCKKISTRSHEEPFRFEDARPGENYPPLHPRCRCEVNPTVDDWADWIRCGTGGPQDRLRAAERFGAARVDLHAHESDARVRRKLEDRFRRVHFKTGSLQWKDYIELRASASSSVALGEVHLEKGEYARGMSELATYIPRSGVDEGTIVKAIGDFVYTVEVKAHDYRIVGRRRIE